MCFVAEIIFV